MSLKIDRKPLGIFAAFLSVFPLLMPLMAADYYVNPDPDLASDRYDGTRKVLEPGTLHGPKLTLKGAMEIDGLTAGDVVHAAPGVYSEGVMAPINGEFASNRVSVVAGVGIVAEEGNAVTFIEGYVPPVTPTSISTNGGPDSIRCVAFLKSDNAGYVKGFTLRNGSTPIKSGTEKIIEYWGGGVFRGTVIDCIITNCYAVRGAGAGRSKLIRSRILDCDLVRGKNDDGRTASVQGTASICCSFYDSHIVGSSTFVETAVNSVFEGATSGDTTSESTWGNAFNCWFSADSASGLNNNGRCIFGSVPSLDVYMRPNIADAKRKGSVAHYVYPARFEDEAGTDILGRPRFADGKIDIGCYQGAPMTFYVDAENGNDDWDGLAATNSVPESSTRGPRRTLVAAMAIKGLVSGDSVCAMRGVYDEGEVCDDVTKATNRVSVVGGVTLYSAEGADVTFIEGAPSINEGGVGTDAVRGVFLKNGASLKGFTVRNGYTPVGVNGAGIYLYSYSAAVDCRIVDCVAGGRHAVACDIVDGALIRCYVKGNLSKEDGVGDGFGIGSCYGCVFEGDGGDVYTLYGKMVNCTFLGKASLTGLRPTDGGMAEAKAYNCLFRGSTPARAQLYRCFVSASEKGGYLTLFDDTVFTNDVSLIACDDSCRPVSGSLAIDFGNSAYATSTEDGGLFPADWVRYADLDFAGGQRVYNAAIDAGAGEYDWRPDFGRILGKGVSVSSASPDVTAETDAVRIPEGELVLDWTRSGVPVRSFAAAIDATSGSGNLTVMTNGTAFAGLDTGSALFGLYVPQDSLEMKFGYAGDGSALISSFRGEVGFSIIVR